MVSCFSFPSRPENHLEYNEQNLFSWDSQMIMNSVSFIFHISIHEFTKLHFKTSCLVFPHINRVFQNITAFRNGHFTIQISQKRKFKDEVCLSFLWSTYTTIFTNYLNVTEIKFSVVVWSIPFQMPPTFTVFHLSGKFLAEIPSAT